VTPDCAQLVPILMYHSVSDRAHPTDLPYTVTPDEFRRHVEVLQAWGARTLSVADYAARLRGGQVLPERSAIVTVDDAYADTAEELLPALSAAGLSATVFVTTGTVGRRVRESRMIEWGQITDLHRAGFEIGSHSHHHIELDMVDPVRAREEMATSRTILEDHLSAPVTTFAYPHGCYTNRLRTEAAHSGYVAACGVKHRLSHPGDDLYALARLIIYRGTEPSSLLAMIEGRSARPATTRVPLWRHAWRLGRKARALLHSDDVVKEHEW
jgi:peptidoglycan/xylan/chitin deacetylase (PgdA/CDA1 family)